MGKVINDFRHRVRLLRGLASLALLLGLGGCELFTEPERVRVSVEVEALSYAPGDTVRVTLRNEERTSWYFLGGCPSNIQRWDGNSWVPIADYCGLSRTLDPGLVWLSVAPLEVPARGTAELWFVLPAGTAEGTYRAVAGFFAGPTTDSRSVGRASATFQVLNFSLAAR